MKERKVTRLENYDYSSDGYYFITIVTKDREKILSEINLENIIILTGIGKLIEKSILFINQNENKVLEYIIMPNHIHLIIKLKNSEKSILKIVEDFKKFTTRKIKKDYGKILWQRSYYEKVIRNENQYIELLNYIRENRCLSSKLSHFLIKTFYSFVSDLPLTWSLYLYGFGT